MKGLLKKFRENKKGFTLAELLVVVAIVAILVAISVPIFTSQLSKARQATNKANMRAAKVAAVAKYLSDEENGNKVYYSYNMDEGVAAKVTSITDADYEKTEIDDAAKDRVYENDDIVVSVETGDATDKTKNTAVVSILIKK